MLQRNKRLRGMSIQTMVVAGIIGAILTAVAISYLWEASEKMKIAAIASSIKSEGELLSVLSADDFKKIEEVHKNGDGDEDYLDELVEAGLAKPPGDNLFDDNYTWEIRRIVEDGHNDIYYIYVNTTSDRDKERLRKAIEKAGYPERNVIEED